MTTRYVYSDADAPRQAAYQYVSGDPVYRYQEPAGSPTRRGQASAGVVVGQPVSYVVDGRSSTVPARHRSAPAEEVYLSSPPPVMRPIKQLEPYDSRLRQRRPGDGLPAIAPDRVERYHSYEPTYVTAPHGLPAHSVVYEEAPIGGDWYYHYPEGRPVETIAPQSPVIRHSHSTTTTLPTLRPAPAPVPVPAKPPQPKPAGAKPSVADRIKALPKGALYAGVAVAVLIVLKVLWVIVSLLLSLLQTEIVCAANVQASECKHMGCVYDAKKAKCALPLPAKILSKAPATRALFVGNDPSEKTPCLTNLLAAAGGSDSTTGTTPGSRYRRVLLKPLELFLTPGLDVFSERGAHTAVKRMMAGLRLGENLQSDFTQWTPDRGNAIDRLVLVFDAEDALVKGWFSSSVNAEIIEDWARFTERMDTGFLPPLVVLHTAGASGAEKVKAAMVQQFHRLPAGTSFDLDCNAVTPLDAAKLLHAITADTASASARDSAGYSYRHNARARSASALE